MKVYIICALVLATYASLAEVATSDDLAEYNKKYQEAKDALHKAQNMLNNDYIQSFAKVLEDGVDKLNAATLESLKTIQDPAKRQEKINYAVKAYDRLLVFLVEIQEQ